MMKYWNIKVLKVVLPILFVGLVVMLFINSYNREKTFYRRPLNGVIESKFRSTSTLLFKLNSTNEPINLYLNNSYRELLTEGDSIAKDPNSTVLRIFNSKTQFEYFDVGFTYFNPPKDPSTN